MCACFKHVSVRHDIAHRIKGIREGLDVIALNRDQLSLVQSHSHEEEPRQLTNSGVDVMDIYGRDFDKQKILSMLLCETSQQETRIHVPILSLVGTGGFVDDIENPSIYEAKKLRTLIVKASKSVPSALHQLTCLRTLVLSGAYDNGDFVVLPSEVSRLLHLRYLDLSKARLKKLPETMRSLVNLQTLKLNSCPNLCKLPEGIGELSNLRHLEVEDTNALKYYPRGGIERLSQLRTLSKFVVSDGSSKRSVIGELGNLNFLKGRLSITRLRHIKSVNEAKHAELQKKKNISELRLYFGDREYAPDIGHVSSKEEIRRMEGVLENLEPHKESLERLFILDYVGSTLPTWMRMMSNITSLCLFDCPNLKVEPHYLFPPRLESVVLEGDVGVLSKSLMSLTHNNNLKFLDIISLPHSSLSQGLNQLTSLQRLSFLRCEFLDFKPEELKPLTMLRKLEIYRCPIINRERSREEYWSILTHIPNIVIVDYEACHLLCLLSKELLGDFWTNSLSLSATISADIVILLSVKYDAQLEDGTVVSKFEGWSLPLVMERESWDMNTPEKIEAAGKKKEEGNVAFIAGKYAKASQRYEKAGKFIEYNTNFSEEENKKSKVLKLADLDLAEIDIKKAFEIDPNYRKQQLRQQGLTVRCDGRLCSVHWMSSVCWVVSG
ncbi:hypothetical protein IFM89_034891 [Coptis chinensis]|uniref:Disease resistance R13L4/SHOC-2-like LRR domain-containing protein n=1 Tax=Coptis chinensis TaxID=261450 RepID=A0A835LXB1_9MAGN|nr:hypothetical protein IFM89_034891 [Coptis chinensis]